MGRWGCQRQILPCMSLSITEQLRYERTIATPARRNTGGGKALCSPPCRTIPRAAMWITKLKRPGKKHSKVTILTLMAQGQAHKPLCQRHWHHKEAGQQLQHLRGAGHHSLGHHWVPWWPQPNSIVRCGWGGFLKFFSKWQIVVVGTEAYDQLLYTILRGTHKQHAMLWLKSSSWYPALMADWGVRRSDTTLEPILLFFFFLIEPLQ